MNYGQFHESVTAQVRVATVQTYLTKRPFAQVAAGGILYVLTAWISDRLPHQGGLAALWLPNAILLALLLETHHPGRRMALAAGALLGGFVSLVLRGMPIATWFVFPAANVLESVTGAMLVWRMGGLLGTFERVADVLRMAAVALIAPILPALIAMVALHIGQGLPWVSGFYAWYGTAALSMILVTPATLVGITAWRDRQARQRILKNITELGTLMILIASAAVLIFAVIPLPSMFMLMPVLIFAAFRQRQSGAIAGLLVMAFVVIEATLNGHGPIAHTTAFSPELRTVMMQLYLGAAFLIALPVASALTERDARAQEANVLAEQFRSVVENVGEVIFRTDSAGRWTYLNPAWLAVSGHDIAGSIGVSWLTHVEANERLELEGWARPILTGEIESSRRLVRLQTAHQGWRWMEVTLQTLVNTAGHVLGATGTMRDIDDRKRLEEHVLSAKRQAEARAAEAVMLAATDELTGLANRRAFLRHLNRHIEASRELGQTFALAIFDVDHFKAVNDAFGHGVGDRVLQRVAARALASVRSGDLVGRIGGEEFGILMPGANPQDAALVAERLCRSIESVEMPLEDALPTVTVSVGVAALGQDRDAGELMVRADNALYDAKAAGRNRIKMVA